MCVCLFVIGVMTAFLTICGNGGRGPSDGVTRGIEFLLAAPIVAGAICLVWFIAALTCSYNE